MKSYWAEYKVKIPPKAGNPPIKEEVWQFDEASQRKKILSNVLGLDPETSDEDLKNTKIEFGLSFIKDSMFVDENEEEENNSAYTILVNELKISKESHEHLNKFYDENYEWALKNYELGYISEHRVTLSFDDKIRERQIQSIKDNNELVGEIVIKESIPFLHVDDQDTTKYLKVVKYKDHVIVTTPLELDLLIVDAKNSLGLDISEDIDILGDDPENYDTFLSIEDFRHILYGPAESQEIAESLIDRTEEGGSERSRFAEFTEAPSEEDIFSKMINL